MARVKVFIEEDAISALVDAISDACDGQSMAVILVAFSDMLAAMGNGHPTITVEDVLTDFNSLMEQRHGHNSIRIIN